MGWDTSNYANEADLDGRRIPESGIYHVGIGEVDLQPTKKDGSAKEGIEVPFQIYDGTTPGQVGIVHTEFFAWPSPAHKDGGDFCMRKMVKLALATELLSPDQLGGEIDPPDFSQMGGLHLVVEIEKFEEQGDNGRTYTRAQIKGFEIWHVNHPNVASVPKDADVCKDVPMSREWDAPAETAAKAPAKAAAKTSAPKPGAPKPGAPKAAAAAAPKPGVSPQAAPAAGKAKTYAGL